MLRDADGNTLSIGAGTLGSDTMASIQTFDVNSLDMPLPATGILDVLSAVDIELDGASTNVPMQLALKVNSQIDSETGHPKTLAEGTEVLFWRQGTFLQADGQVTDIWWLVDNGVIGNDGLAHTASPPCLLYTSRCV